MLDYRKTCSGCTHHRHLHQSCCCCCCSCGCTGYFCCCCCCSCRGGDGGCACCRSCCCCCCSRCGSTAFRWRYRFHTTCSSSRPLLLHVPPPSPHDGDGAVAGSRRSKGSGCRRNSILGNTCRNNARRSTTPSPAAPARLQSSPTTTASLSWTASHRYHRCYRCYHWCSAQYHRRRLHHRPGRRRGGCTRSTRLRQAARWQGACSSRHRTGTARGLCWGGGGRWR